MKILVAGALLCALCAPVLAQDAGPNAASSKKEVAINAGELRLDGKIKALLDAGVWQVDVQSWTSPRQVKTEFSESKSKIINVAADAYIHPLGEQERLALKDVKLGTRVAVIGKNAADGSVSAREVVLLEGYGEREHIGVVQTNPVTSALIDQSRKARTEGDLTKALAFADQAISAAQGVRDLSGEGLATQDKVGLYFDLEQLDKAGESAARVEVIGRSLTNPLLMSMGMAGQAEVYAATGQLEKATQLLEAADPISAGSEPKIHLSVLQSLADVYRQAGTTNKLVATLQRVFPLEESVGENDDATGTLLRLATILAKTQTDQANAYLKQAAPRIDTAADGRKRAGLRVLSAQAKFALGDKAGARTEFNTAATLYEGAGDAKAAAAVRAMPAKMEAASKPAAPSVPPGAAPGATDNAPGDAPADATMDM